MARELRFASWPLPPSEPPARNLAPSGEKHLPDGTPNYAYLDAGRWWDLPPGHCCSRGFVAMSQFAAQRRKR